MKNQKGFGIVEAFLLLVIVGIIGGVIYYVYNANKQETNISDSSVQHREAISKDKFIDEVKNEVENLGLDNLSEAKITKPTPESGYASIQIFDEDGYSTGIQTSVLEIVLEDGLDCPVDNYGEEPCPDDIDWLKETENSEKIYGAISSVASKNSLTEDSINSYEFLKAKQANVNVPFEQYSDTYTAYGNDSFTCIIKLPGSPSNFDPNREPDKISIALGCVDMDDYKKQQELQKLLLNAFHKQHDIKLEPYSGEGVGVDKIDGDFVYGSTVGAYAVWKKIDGNWEYLFGGHESPNCSEADGYDIPEDLMEPNPAECYDGEELRPIR